MTTPIAYVSADPGIAPDGTKGAAVHFRSLAAAFARLGVELDVHVARAGDLSGFRPHRARAVPTPAASGLLGEVQQIGHASAMLAQLQASGPHKAVYERLSLFGLAGLLHARSRGIPLLVEVNAPLWREAATYRGLGLCHAARGICLDVLTAAERVFVVTKSLGHELAEAGVDGGRIEVLGNGADLAAFRAAAPAPKPPTLRGRPTLMFFGSLKPWHGVPFLLRAFAALRRQRPCGLWIIGDGPERQAIEVAARSMPGDIVLEGAVAHDRVPSLLQAADAVVAPYPAAAPAYFSPLKVVEALAAGRPLLASRTACVLEALGGHEPAGLFAADDVADFVRVAMHVLDLDPSGANAGVPGRHVEALDWQAKALCILAAIGPALAPPEAVRG